MDHHEITQNAIDVSDTMYECVRLVACAVFPYCVDPVVAHQRAVVLIRENGGMAKFRGLRKWGKKGLIDWTEADLSGIVL